MPYTSQTDILTYITANDLNAALDDTGSGMADPVALANLINLVSADIDGRLAPTYQTPFTGTVPQIVRTAATIFACQAIKRRTLPADVKTPFDDQAKDLRDMLTKIGIGELDLDVNQSRAFFQGGAVLYPELMNSGSTLGC